MTKLVCDKCNYMYEPTLGGGHVGLSLYEDASILYEGLSEDWVCPGCGADKSHLKVVKVVKEEKK